MLDIKIRGSKFMLINDFSIISYYRNILYFFPLNILGFMAFWPNIP